jgi:hypothetical protein
VLCAIIGIVAIRFVWKVTWLLTASLRIIDMKMTLTVGENCDAGDLEWNRDDVFHSYKFSCVETLAAGRLWPENGPKSHIIIIIIIITAEQS